MISIHTPAKGATASFLGQIGIEEFQSTHPRRVRQPCRVVQFQYETISIHTPAKGATLVSAVDMKSPSYFNPHTREGCDKDFPISFFCRSYFNPHTREGCDHMISKLSIDIEDFNPHTREGCDLFCWAWTDLQWDFNPHTREGCDAILPGAC